MFGENLVCPMCRVSENAGLSPECRVELGPKIQSYHGEKHMFCYLVSVDGVRALGWIKGDATQGYTLYGYTTIDELLMILFNEDRLRLPISA